MGTVSYVTLVGTARVPNTTAIMSDLYDTGTILPPWLRPGMYQFSIGQVMSVGAPMPLLNLWVQVVPSTTRSR